MKLTNRIRSAWVELSLQLRIVAQSIRAFASFIFSGAKDCITPVGRLYATVIHADGAREKIGLICTKVVTTAGVDYLVQGLIVNTTDVSLFSNHASGTGTTAEAVGDTALVTETGSRVAGSKAVGASNNIFRTIATVSYTSTLAITEHGVFTASTGGTLLDRSVFSAINVINGDSIQFTYELTLPAGS